MYGNYDGVRTAYGSTPPGEYNVGGGLGGSRSIRTNESEQGHSVHYYTTNSETLWGGCAEVRYPGLKKVVGIEGVGPDGGAGGGSAGGGTRRGGHRGGRGVSGE